MATTPSGWGNVADVFKSIATLQPIKAKTGLGKTADTAVGLISQSAGTAALGLGTLGLGALAASGITGGSIAAKTSVTAATTAGTAAASKGLGTAALIASGAAAGYLLAPKGSGGSGGSSSPTVTTNPKQETTASQQTNPIITNNNQNYSSQRTNNINYGAGSINSTASQTPTLSTPTNIYPTQDIASTQGVTPTVSAIGGSGGSSGGTDWTTIALIGGVAYLILRD